MESYRAFLALKVFLAEQYEPAHKQRGDGKRTYGGKCKLPAVPKHREQRAEDYCRAPDNRGKAPRQALRYAVYVVGGAAQHVAHRVFVVVAKRYGIDFFTDAGS